MLTLHPTAPEPVTAEEGRTELIAMWDGLDVEGRRLLMAHARAVAEVTGRPRRVAARHAADVAPPGKVPVYATRALTGEDGMEFEAPPPEDC